MPNKRNRAYYRKQRIKHIKRKKNISEHCYGYDWYQVDGAYSKGKIHCSCPLHSARQKLITKGGMDIIILKIGNLLI